MSRGFLLDTCVFAEYTNQVPQRSVIEWIDDQSHDTLFISAVTIGEIEKGIARLPDSKRRRAIESVLEALIVRFGKRALPITVGVARRWGKLSAEAELKGRPLPALDCMIAATALEHDLVIVTRNTADFEKTGATLLDVWQD